MLRSLLLVVLLITASLVTMAQSVKARPSGPQVVQLYPAGDVTPTPPIDPAEGGGTPPNDLCNSVTPVVLAVPGNQVFTGNSTGALDNDGLGVPLVWHAFTTGQCANVTVAYCGTSGVWLSILPELFIGCPSTSYVTQTTLNTTTCPDGNVTSFFDFLAPGTYYIGVVGINPGSVGPYTVTVTTTSCAVGYCPAGAQFCDEFIASVQFGSILNTSGCADGPAVDYTGITTNVSRGTAEPIFVLNGPDFYPEDQVGVWVDWNQNQSFFDPGEFYLLDSAGMGATFSGTITVPFNATLGTTRMRIRMHFSGSGAINPCGTPEYGEVEDYGVIVDVGTGVGSMGNTPWNVYPNPADGQFTVVGDLAGPVEFELYDMMGRLARTEQRSLVRDEPAQFDWSGAVAPGSYLLRSVSDFGRFEQRLVIH